MVSRATQRKPGLLSVALFDEFSFSVFSAVRRPSTISHQAYADLLTPTPLSPKGARGSPHSTKQDSKKSVD